MPWQRARIDESCGSCADPIAAGEVLYAMYPGGLQAKRRLVRCWRCGERITDTRPGDELSEDTTAPQPSFPVTPVERLPNVVSQGYLARRREVAVARLERWRARRGWRPS